MGQRRKHVTQTASNQDVEPPADNQQIVRALGARGGNIVEVEYPNGSSTLCMMPAKFNRKLWVRRGGFLIIENSPEAEEDAGSRVTATIVAVLYDEHVKQLKKMPGVWPEEFTAAVAAANTAVVDLGLPPSGSAAGSEDGDEDQQQQQQLQAASSVVDQTQQQNSGGAAAAAAGQGSQQHQAVAVAAEAAQGSEEEEDDSDDGLPPLQQINNRRVVNYEASDGSEEESEGE